MCSTFKWCVQIDFSFVDSHIDNSPAGSRVIYQLIQKPTETRGYLESESWTMKESFYSLGVSTSLAVMHTFPTTNLKMYHCCDIYCVK